MDLKRALALSAAFAIAFALVGQGRAQDAALTARIQAAYDAQCADIIHGDFTAFEATLSPNFLATVQGTTVTRDEMVSGLKSGLGTVSLTSCKTFVDSVTQSGNVLIVMSRRLIDGTDPASHKAPLELAGGTRDMWIEQGNGLVETSSMGLWGTVSVNGQIVRTSGDVPSSPPLETNPPAPPAGATP